MKVDESRQSVTFHQQFQAPLDCWLLCVVLLDSVDNLTDKFPTWIDFSNNQTEFFATICDSVQKLPERLQCTPIPSQPCKLNT